MIAGMSQDNIKANYNLTDPIGRLYEYTGIPHHKQVPV
jgi:hypothetical protein